MASSGKKVPSVGTVASWHDAIGRSGVTRLRLRALLQHFGQKRRGSGSAAFIEEWLKDQGLFVRGLRDASGLDESVLLSDHEMTQIGALATSELALQERFPAEMAPQLGLGNVQPEYSPSRTRDRLDFLCRDERGSVAVEIKREGGDKRGVEQLMRYIGYLRREGADGAVRGLLITGYADPYTRHALEGRDRDEHIDWWLYGLVDGDIRLKPVVVERHRAGDGEVALISRGTLACACGQVMAFEVTLENSRDVAHMFCKCGRQLVAKTLSPHRT
ncbi:MAG: endonuclease NucS [Polyangiaceae bacterium]